jgi:hypothetical protein
MQLAKHIAYITHHPTHKGHKTASPHTRFSYETDVSGIREKPHTEKKTL